MKTYKILLSLLALLQTVNVAAAINPAPGIIKGSFTGIITDKNTQAPLADVSVYFADLKTGTTTKPDGSFSILNIPQGSHLVEISHIGYTTIAETIDINGDTHKDYQMETTVVENNAVIITGAGAATQLKKSPFQVSLLRKEDFLHGSATNIIDALAKQPGVSAISTGPAISKPVIRGLGYNRVLTVNDGVRQEGQQWGDEHGIEIDEVSVNKVEILKGPASLIYGSDAMAGVINIITNVPVENNTVKANILSSYQTNNNARLINANIAGNINGFNWNLYNTSSAAADYRNQYDGRVFNSKYGQQNLGGYAGYNGNWGYSHLLVSNFNLKAGLTEGERDEEGYFIKPVAGGGEVKATDADFTSSTPMVPYQHIRHFKIATDNSFKLGQNRLTLNVGYQRNQREEFGNPEDAKERELYFDLRTITYTAQLHLKEMGGWKTSLGVNGMRQQNINRGLEQLIPDYRLLDVGGYVYTQKTLNKITVSGGARYDTRHINAKNLMEGMDIKSAAFTKSFSNFSASAGFAAQLSKQLNLKLNVARAYRAPSLPELASNGAHEGTTRYEYGDNNLKTETSIQLDAGMEFNTEHVSMNVSVFYNSFSNFIYYRKLQAANGNDSTLSIDGSELTAFKFDQRKAVLSGVEASIDIHPHPLDWLHFENTFSFTRGRFAEAVEGSADIPFIPAARLISELRCNVPKLTQHITNLYAKAELDNTFRQGSVFTAYNTETITPGYSLLNAGIGADFTGASKKVLFSIHIAANNLTDVAYQNHLSRLKYAAENMATGRRGVFNMGRNFSIKINIPFTLTVNPK